MDTLEAIRTRRSIRKYNQKAVPRELVEELLEAAMSAPSAGNEQPWHFIVIEDRKILDEVPKYHPYSNAVKEARVAIVVCADLQMSKFDDEWWPQDCAAATQNILLAAHARGLGTVWLGVYPVKERVEGIHGLLALPENVIPLCILPLGFPAEEKPLEKRYQPSRIRYNRW